jgi:hypothetical protein
MKVGSNQIYLNDVKVYKDTTVTGKLNVSGDIRYSTNLSLDNRKFYETQFYDISSITISDTNSHSATNFNTTDISNAHYVYLETFFTFKVNGTITGLDKDNKEISENFSDLSDNKKIILSNKFRKINSITYQSPNFVNTYGNQDVHIAYAFPIELDSKVTDIFIKNLVEKDNESYFNNLVLPEIKTEDIGKEINLIFLQDFSNSIANNITDVNILNLGDTEMEYSGTIFITNPNLTYDHDGFKSQAIYNSGEFNILNNTYGLLADSLIKITILNKRFLLVDGSVKSDKTFT